MRFFALSDIHGHLAELNTALALIDARRKDGDMVVFCGDYVDKGDDSLGVLKAVHRICAVERRGVALLGNHEEMFLDWLYTEDEWFQPSWYVEDYGFQTLRSFIPMELIGKFADESYDEDLRPGTSAVFREHARWAVLEEHGLLLAWVRGLPRYLQTDRQVFVHAGVNESAGDLWKLATPDHMFTEKVPASTGPFLKDVIAGHVWASGVARDLLHRGVYWDGESHFYIDGSVYRTGLIPVLIYDTDTGRYSTLVESGGGDWVEIDMEGFAALKHGLLPD